MARTWVNICVFVLVLVKDISASRPPGHEDVKFQLSKSLGISKPKLNKNLEDHRLGQEYIEQYQEMIKASQESYENFDEKRLRRVIGDDDLELMAEAGGLPRRRSGGKLQSAVGRRRARSQAIRRNKLNIQGLRSHKLHSKQTNLDYTYDTY